MNISFNDKINNYHVVARQGQQMNNFNLSNNLNRKQNFNGVVNSVEKFATSLVEKPMMQKCLTGKCLNKFLKLSIENPGLYEALLAVVITCSARPATIMGIPGAKWEDKQYAAAQSMASGLTGLAFAIAVFQPIEKSLNNILNKVNNQNLKTAFSTVYENLYTKPEYKDILEELLSHKAIPTKDKFNELVSNSSDIVESMQKYFKNDAKNSIDKLLSGDDEMAKQKWSNASSVFSTNLKETFDKVKNNNVANNKKYLVPESITFLKEGTYNLKNSIEADKTKHLLGFTSKIILFPALAFATIYTIPKIMKFVFPNHKKSKSKTLSSVPNSSIATDKYANFTSAHVQNNKIFEQFTNKPATSMKQVSFSGGMHGILNGVQTAYEKVYKTPLSNFLSKIFEKVTFSDKFAHKMQDYVQPDVVNKYGMDILSRDKAGKILTKWDNSFIASNLPEIAALTGSCFYIGNTIRNKEIDPERKPALCTNMAVVAVFSTLAGKGIDKIATPFFDVLKKKHGDLMKNKLNYDINDGWKCARKLLTTTFAFRYLGPVLATPAADKLVKLFNKKSVKTEATKKE